MALIYLISVVPLVLLHGWVLSLLWKWFFVPIFGLPELRLVEAIGISLVISFFLFRAEDQKDDEDKEKMMLRKMISNFVAPFAFLAFGWIVRSFM